MEIEAKFALPDRATFDLLCHLTNLLDYRIESAGVKQVHDRYLDTNDRAFLRAGYAFRARRKGADLVATLKGLGGADTDSGIHKRAEYELVVEGDDPAAWPEGSTRELALQVSAGRSLTVLFSLNQERHIFLLYSDAPEGSRRVAELSLDVVAPKVVREDKPHLYYELEIELLDQGSESDLHALAQHLKMTWGLRPESRSKFERGLALIDEAPTFGRQGEKMDGSLTASERAVLHTWLEIGNQPERRRARIILLLDEGYTSSAIASEVGLSVRQVRRWLAAFRAERMGIFPVRDEIGQWVEQRQKDQIESHAKTGPLADVTEFKLEEPGTTVPVTVDELCVVNGLDTERAEFVKNLSCQLFDLMADMHRLASGRRSLLETAATLHDLGRDLILAQPIAGLDSAEQDMLANVVAFRHKKLGRHNKALKQLPADLRRETLALTALLRMASGLNTSRTQSAALSRSEAGDGCIIVVIDGPAAQEDVAGAQRRANLWGELFDIDVHFVTEEQLAQTPLVIDFRRGVASLPELDAPGLLPDDPMSEAGRKSLWFHFLRMLKHESGTRAGEDIEELHDMRVATRRMRAAVRVFGDFFEPEAIAPFNKGIRRVTRVLGQVRDLDVFEEKAGHYLETLPDAARDGLDPLLETWRTERATAREKMIASLDSDRYRKFKGEFGEFLQTERAGARPIPHGLPVPYEVRHVAPRLIYTRYEAVRAYETVLEDAQIETLHALRIDCKYLRYTLEFLREVLGPEAGSVIKEVKAMQDHLGDLNDADVAIQLLNDFLRDWDTTEADVPLSQRRSVEGVVTYLAARHAEKHRLLTTFPETWARLNREEVRRWMALAVAAL